MPGNGADATGSGNAPRGAASVAMPGNAGAAAVAQRGAGSASVPGGAPVPATGKGTGKASVPGQGRNDGFGPGSGDGFGPGSGDGFGPGSGDGFGPGNGDGFGPGSGDGFGPGSGDGFGPGSGDGFEGGDGSGSGDGDGFRDEGGKGTGTIAVARAGSAAGVPRNRTGMDSGPGGEPERGLSELRQKLRSQRRLRLITLTTLAAVVLLVLPAFFGIRAVSSDPVFASLDALNVPSWADQKPDDKNSGSRWCFGDCRFRERTTESQRPFKETTEAYSKALTEAGWSPWKVAGCPESPIKAEEGTYTCWRRDEFTLDLAVGLPGCAVDQVAADALPDAGTDQAEAGTKGAQKCADGSTVSIKVRDEITDERGKVDQHPGPVGATPDPVLNQNDPLLQPTPQAS
ncbi:Collagen alpha-5(VI) chain [Actinoplanes sp. SE50]|nr:Collagen alpha-5(VI) chain [Actinoplanes sp. SE50/110]ATO85775.1 Collagen alpha-5(VI) chain [Actinoplanes sp. SE50]SLM03188.1 Collagen alpha-5(VI) chain [Actinoplanes sp. SE50/110]